MNFRICFLLLLFPLCLTPSYGQIISPDGRSIEAAALDEFLQSQMETLKIPGLSIAIINDSKVVYKQTFGVINNNTKEKVDEKTLFEAASISKSLFAYFAMQMVEKGLLDLDTPLYTYLPYPDIEHDERYKLITARMVLSHTSGFPNWRFHNEDGKLDIKFTPGTRFSYSGEGYKYLAKVIAHLNGKTLHTLDEFFREEFARPLGMEHSSYTKSSYWVKHKAYGHAGGEVVADRWYTDLSTFGAAHSLHTNADEFSKFMIAFMEEKGLEKETFDKMLEEQVRLPEDSELRTAYGYDSWALGFIRSPTPYGTKYAHGGMNADFQAYFMILKEKNYGFVFFANADNGLELLEPLEQYLLNGEKAVK